MEGKSKPAADGVAKSSNATAPDTGSNSAPPMLGDAGGGDCAFNTLVYNKAHKRGEPKEKLEGSASPFLNDLCDLDRILLGINGETVELQRRGEVDRGWRAGSQRVYANPNYTVELKVGELVEEFPAGDELTHCRTRAYVTIGHGEQRWKIDGTLAYDLAESSCP